MATHNSLLTATCFGPVLVPAKMLAVATAAVILAAYSVPPARMSRCVGSISASATAPSRTIPTGQLLATCVATTARPLPATPAHTTSASISLTPPLTAGSTTVHSGSRPDSHRTVRTPRRGRWPARGASACGRSALCMHRWVHRAGISTRRRFLRLTACLSHSRPCTLSGAWLSAVACVGTLRMVALSLLGFAVFANVRPTHCVLCIAAPRLCGYD